ncbi:MAG: NADH:ubiquinone oxidoreductase subunit NDUFA12 [Alphaproteobacteria bacterium]|nr:MAG: NADH:ubiquinone oxidoreductase subunit NDUFA12 [Alphaproteobacteria bacterium]
MHIGTWLHTLRHGTHIGTDMFGNKYYTERKARAGQRAKRWVVYKGIAEPSKVPPVWHAWLHYTIDQLPTDLSTPHYAWLKEHQPNLTGTKFAYKPKGHVASGGVRNASTSDYQAWSPDGQ